MLPTHKNPVDNNDKLKLERTASAPYNFVPLPEIVASAINDPEKDLPDQDRFHTNRKTGYFEVELTTRSPLYVRCALPLAEFMRSESEEEKQRPFRERVKNKPDFFYKHDPKQPVIPGSSLRGMLRNLLEAVSYGKIAEVMASPKIFFRAVAAESDDPLKQPYIDIIGNMAKNVRAGYLVKTGDDWAIRPASTLNALRWAGDENRPEKFKAWRQKTNYFKLKEEEIPDGAIPDLLRLNSPIYKPQYHKISFDIQQITKRVRIKGKERVFDEPRLAKIGIRDTKLSNEGELVCSGNMLETGDETQVSPRKTFVIIPRAGAPAGTKKINPQAVQDYLDALTDFQKEEPPFDTQMGMLKEGRPIFYVDESGDEIYYFGHCPNFRIPAVLHEERRAATPNDFVPDYCKETKTLDFAEAIFGYVKGSEVKAAQGEKARAYASRVFVTDAKCDEQAPWLQAAPFVPRILASPKPTAFQHYLVQPNRDEPNKPRLLYHYGDWGKTVIRGRKFYWHQGRKERTSNENWRTFISEKGETLQEIAAKEMDKRYDTQHTQFKPVKPETKFTFRVYFENLSDVELGALCWVLQPLAHPELSKQEKDICHHLGMGKPLGMGSVKLNATLFFTDRKTRYEKLFDDGNDWQTGVRKEKGKLMVESLEHYRDEFEHEVLKRLNLYPKHEHLYDLKRIAMLLKLMEWPGFPAELDQKRGNLFLTDQKRPNTRYMTITLPGVEKSEANEYKERPVLPDPETFGGLLGAKVVPAIADKIEAGSDASSQFAASKRPQNNPQQQPSTPDTSKRKTYPPPPPQPPLDTSKDAQALLKSIEKQQRTAEAQAQSVYKNNEVEKKATVVKKEDGSLCVALPKLKGLTFPLKRKPVYSQAAEGAKVRVRVMLGKNNAITQVEEI